MVSFVTKSYSKKLLHLISWSHWFTFFNIIAAITLSSFYLFSETAPTTLLGQLYLVTTWVSHIGFLTFMSFVLILFPITLIYPHTKFIRTSGSIIFTVGLLLLVLDGFIYSRLGYHLNASSRAQILELIKDIAQENILFYIVSGALAIIVLGFEFTISNYAWKHLKQLQKTVFARFVIFALVVSFFISHLTHIWADANLDYDILRQDTVLPLSYPATAKTLLTKYGLFNIEDYIERKNSPLSFNREIPTYPHLNPTQCSVETNTQSVFLILTEQQIKPIQFQQFIHRANGSSYLLSNNIDTGKIDDAWFNLFYSLPSIYQEEILKQGTKPFLFQALSKQKLTTSLTIISPDNSVNTSTEFLPFSHFFEPAVQLNNVSTLLFADKLNNKPPGLHVIYFKQGEITDNEQSDHQYQFELFVDALLLAQKQKSQKDIVWVSTIGNQLDNTRLLTKQALLINPTSETVGATEHTEVAYNTSNMDLQATLMKHWLACDVKSSSYSNGNDLLGLTKDRVIANTTELGIMVFNKDKSVLIDQYGNFQSYSSQLAAPITVNADFPLMIDGMQFIKQFSKQKQLSN